MAYLGHRAPTLDVALAGLRAAGHTRVVVWPLFLASGGHVTDDIAPMVERAREAGLEVELLAPLLDDDTFRAALRATLPT